MHPLLFLVVGIIACVNSTTPGGTPARLPLRKDREEVAVAVVQVIEQSIAIPEEWKNLLLFTPPFDGEIGTKRDVILLFAALVTAGGGHQCDAFRRTVSTLARGAGAATPACGATTPPLTREALADLRLAQRLSIML